MMNNLPDQEKKSTVASKGKTKLTLGISNNGVNFASCKSSILLILSIRDERSFY